MLRRKKGRTSLAGSCVCNSMGKWATADRNTEQLRHRRRRCSVLAHVLNRVNLEEAAGKTKLVLIDFLKAKRVL